MSAFLCDDATFDYLAEAARVYGGSMLSIYTRSTMPDLSELLSEGILSSRDQRLCPITDNDKIAAILQYQNVRSIKARYPNCNDMLNDEPYEFRSVPRSALTPAAVLKSIACVRYQSCETDDFDQTLAAAILNAIEHYAIAALPGYDDAPWGWTRPEQVTR